jgi:hypothetical protein
MPPMLFESCQEVTKTHKCPLWPLGITTYILSMFFEIFLFQTLLDMFIKL